MTQKTLYQQLVERPEYAESLQKLSEEERKKVEEFSKSLTSKMDDMLGTISRSFANQSFTPEEIAKAVSDHKPKN
jgi:hypothetical protein